MKIETSPIPRAILEVIELFSDDLAAVKFGEMEGAVLATASDDVITAAGCVARAEEALEQLRAELARRQELLLQKAQRALAYARVYAEDDAALAGRVEAISLPRSLRRASKSEAEAEAREATATPTPRTRRTRGAQAVEGGIELPLALGRVSLEAVS